MAPIPADLTDRRVEITGPVDRKMIVNALNSGATHYMADFEDANSPTWANNLEGQINLKDRWQGQIEFTDPHTKKRYAIGPKPAVLIVRPRGWHMVEKNVLVDGTPISASMFDLASTSCATPRNCCKRQWPLFLFAQDGEPSRSAPLE